MKKIIFLVLFVAFAITGYTQGIRISDMPTYAGNPQGGFVPVVINGVNRKVDPAYFGFGKVDSLSVSSSSTKDTIWSWKNHAKSTYITIAKSTGGGGGITNLDKTLTDSSITVLSSTGTPVILQKADTSNAGPMSAADKKKLDLVEFVATAQALRVLPLNRLRSDVIYRFIENKIIGDYYWNSTSTLVDDSVMILQRTGTSVGRFLRYYEGAIKAKWFGVLPDDGIDDSYKAQKAINFTIKYGNSARLEFEGGVFNIKNLVVLNYIGGNANYVTVTIAGPCPAYDGQSVSSKATEFYNSDPQAGIIFIQRAANVGIKNIVFRGVVAAPAPGNVNQLVRYTNSDWNSSGTIRDNPVSPEGAIFIDALHSSVTGSNRYPGLEGYYTNTTATGSSKITIDGCAFFNNIVAIGVSMAPGCVNGDNIVSNNCYQYGNKVFWATGQAQTRDNSIIDLYSIGSTEKIIDGRTFGAQTGSAPSVWHSSFNGSTKYLYDASTNFEAVKFIGCYAENLYSGGRSNGQFPVDFTDCNINVTTGSGSTTFQSPLFAQGGPIHFTGGVLAYFDNDRAQGYNFANDIVSFNGTTIQGGVPINWYPTNDLYGNISFDNVTYQNTETTSILKKGVFESYADSYARTFVNPSMIFSDRYNAKYHYRGPYFERLQTDSKKLHIDTTTHRGYFLSANPSLYGLRDYVTTATVVNYSNDIYNASPTGLGWVYRISGDTIGIDYIPFGVDTTVTYDIQNTRIPRFLPRALATTTSGSAVLTNLMIGNQGFPTVGMRVKGTGIPDGTRLIAVGTTTLTMSANATVTADTVQLEDAAINVIGVKGGQELSAPNHIWYYADKFLGYSPSGTYVEGYTVVAAGGFGLAHAVSYIQMGGIGSAGEGLRLSSNTFNVGNTTGLTGAGAFNATTYFVDATPGAHSFIFKDWADLQAPKLILGGGYVDFHYNFNMKGTDLLTSYAGFLNAENNDNEIVFDIRKQWGAGNYNAGSAGRGMGRIEFNTYAWLGSRSSGTGPHADIYIRGYNPSNVVNDWAVFHNTGFIQFPYYVAGVTQVADTTNTKLLVIDPLGNLVRSNWPAFSAAAVNARVDSLIGALVFEAVHNVTSTNTTPVNGDTLTLAPNTQATFHLTFQGYDNTGMVNDALWYERRVLVKYSDGAVPTPYVQVLGTDIAENTLNAIPPPITFVVSGTLVIIKVASPSTMNIPWSIARRLEHVSSITAH